MDAILQFTVTNQTMERTDEFTVVEGSENYLRARFTFVTSDWDGLIKTAVFIDEDADIIRRYVRMISATYRRNGWSNRKGMLV